ncbi:MAG: Uma2 family endonuclease [Deltaproteobacteria bacterium]|nr:Uma2 family endonuclease [Deltaproteobacteria bacterium]
MPLLQNEPDRIFTYKDYLTWNDNERWELIKGVAYNMAPAPSVNHQRVSMELGRQFANFLSDKPCEVFSAPLDVRLPEPNEKDEDTENVVQPDMVVVCDSSKLDKKGCKGAPDLIIEIVSPASASIDNIKKMNLYEKNGVKEYWIVHPIYKIVTIYKIMENGLYGKPETYSEEDKIEVELLKGLTIDLGLVFC